MSEPAKKRARGDEGRVEEEEKNQDLLARIRELCAGNATDAELRRAIMRPLIGDEAPEWGVEALMPDRTFKHLLLDSYPGQWKVLLFYPLDFTFVCPTEIIAFGDRQPEFTAINAQVIAASCDSKFSHLAWVNKPRSEGGLGKMQIPILADFSKDLAIGYGVCRDDGCPLRGLFIIDPSNIIRQITCNDLPVGRNVDEALRLIRAFQFVEKHGEVCPANWQPGDRTMNADPTLSKSYFAEVKNN